VRSLLPVIFVAVLPGCVGVVLPPTQTEIGPTILSQGREGVGGIKVATGTHLASAKLKNPDYDVGAGYVFERVAVRPPAGVEGAIARQDGPPEPVDHHRDAHGAYLDIARRVAGGHLHRTWLGLRSEVLFPAGRSDVAEVGVAARLAWELFGVGEGAGGYSDACGGGFGLASGTTAVGGYLETGYRVSSEGSAVMTTTAGLSFRMPFVAGMGWNLCHHR
jgi:hypothetical protein